jgi:hypothetical protein
MLASKVLRRDAQEGNLPRLCVCCGKPATSFQKHVDFLGLGGLSAIYLPLVIVWIMKQAEACPLCQPVCDRHKHYFFRRRFIRWASFFGAIFLAVWAGIWLGNNEFLNLHLDGHQRFAVVMGAALAILGIGILFRLKLRRCGIHVGQYDTEYITLLRINDRFANAVALRGRKKRRPTRHGETLFSSW